MTMKVVILTSASKDPMTRKVALEQESISRAKTKSKTTKKAC